MHLSPQTPLRGLLRCIDAAFFISSFEEEGYLCIGDLQKAGEEESSSFVTALGMPRQSDEKLLAFAFAADGGAAEAGLPEAEVGKNPAAGCSGAFSAAWLQTVEPLYALHMGCENMGPLLYSLMRFVKPSVCLEIGAGYTTAFLLQALEDNCRELVAWRAWQPPAGAAGATEQREGWLAPQTPEEADEADEAVLHCVDNFAHGGTTAHFTIEVARSLGVERRLQLHLDDARAFVEESAESVPRFDFVWLDGLLDFGRPPPGGGLGDGIDVFLSLIWPRVAPGGFVLLHSTLTNSTVRKWLEGVDGAPWGPPGAVLSLLEPHKRFQNSVTILQRRPEGYAEPIFSTLP